MFYTVTEHTPGYLADSDPYTTESAESAAEYLLSLVDSYADSLTDPDAHTRSDTLADADDIIATCAAELRDEFRPNPERGYMFTCEDPSEIAPLPRVWEITPTTYDPERETVNVGAPSGSVAPGDVVICGGHFARVLRVYTVPPGHTLAPVRSDYTAVVVVTDSGERIIGATRAHIGSDLRMHWERDTRSADSVVRSLPLP